MEEEAVNPEVTAASEELQRMVVNASLMQVLNNINTSLKRIEEHLVPKDKKAKVPSTILSSILEAEGVVCIAQRRRLQRSGRNS
jgi:hypothetical protein